MYEVQSIVPFELLIDTDMGLYKLIQQEYRSPMFRKSILDERDMDVMKLILTERGYLNPLKDFFYDEYKSCIQDADSLYQEFMDKRYKDILCLSCATGIFNMVRRTKFINDYLRFIVLYRKEEEKEYLENRYKKYDFKPCMKKYDTFEEVDLSEYGSVYIKNYRDILKFTKKPNNLVGKNVIYANYKFNCEGRESNVPLQDVTEQIIGTNVIKSIDIYPIKPVLLG